MSGHEQCFPAGEKKVMYAVFTKWKCVILGIRSLSYVTLSLESALAGQKVINI